MFMAEKPKEIIVEDVKEIIEETSTELLNKFGKVVFCGEINEKDFEIYDFYEIYDKSKNYELENYKKIYKNNTERNYKNVVYEGYILNIEENINEQHSDSEEYDKSNEDNKTNDDENSSEGSCVEDLENRVYEIDEDEDESNNDTKSNIGNENTIRTIYIVAKEIYEEDELELLEPYCDCINCENNKKRIVMPYYKKANDDLIFLLIRIVVYFLGSFNSYNITSFLKGFLNIHPMCPCCCGCIKSRHNISTVSVNCARIAYFKDIEIMKNYNLDDFKKYNDINEGDENINEERKNK